MEIWKPVAFYKLNLWKKKKVIFSPLHTLCIITFFSFYSVLISLILYFGRRQVAPQKLAYVFFAVNTNCPRVWRKLLQVVFSSILKFRRQAFPSTYSVWRHVIDSYLIFTIYSVRCVLKISKRHRKYHLILCLLYGRK